MYSWIFKKVGWKFFAVGAATAVVGAKYVRPAIVTLTKTGLDISDKAVGTWNQAKAETSKVLSEASAMRGTSGHVSDLALEVQKLRAEVAALKSTKKVAA